MSPGEDRRTCPYVGLQPFEEGDREYFFGRERDQRIIISNALAAPLTILYGSSGVGKSSVLMGGVIPQLRRDRPRIPVILFRDWVDAEFRSSLARACIDAVWKEGVDQPKPDASLPLDEILRACAEAAHETVLVLLDQFEEYFLYHEKSSDPASFEVQFARAVNRDDVDVGFLIALREDGLSKLDRFQERIPNLLSNRLRLEHLKRDEAADAIRKPLEVWNRKQEGDSPPVRIEDELVDELIRQVGIGRVLVGRQGGGLARSEEGRVEAPFLQLVMVRLWAEETSAGSSVLRRATLDRLQGAMEIVRTHLGTVMDRLEPTSQAVCATFFDRLVTPTGGKVACSADDLLRWAGDLSAEVPQVLESLARHRILRTVASAPDKPEATRYEIFHDVLAPAILDWRCRFVMEQERDQAVKKAREQAEKRGLRRWRAALAAMTVIAVSGWVLAKWEGLQAEANQLATQSVYNATFDAGRGLDLALRAVEKTALFGLSPQAAYRLGLPPTPAAEDALRQAIQASRLEWTLRAGTTVYDVAFDPQGRRLAIAGKDRRVQIWDVSGGHPEPTPIVLPHKLSVRNVAFLASGKRLATTSGDEAYLWSLEAPERPVQVFPHGGDIHSAFALSPDGRRLATAGKGERREIKVWDLTASVPDPAPLATIDTKGAWVMGLAFSPDGCCLATACVELGGADRTATSIWSIDTGTELLRLHNRVASDAVEFTPEGSSLATASRDSRVRVWRPVPLALGELMASVAESAAGQDTRPDPPLEAAQWVERILAGHSERVRNIAVSPDGSRIASAGGDNLVKLWDTETGENLLTLSGHRHYVESAKFSPDGYHLATGSRDRTVKLWNIAGHATAVTSVAFSPDGKALATGGADRTARLWDLSGDIPRLRLVLGGHEDQVYRLAFNPAGSLLATAGFDNRVKLWSTATGKEVATFRKHHDQLRDLDFSPDGRRLATAGADGVAWLFDLDEGDGQDAPLKVTHYEGEWEQTSGVAFHPRLDQWATAGHDGRLQLWSFAGEKLGSIAPPAGERPRNYTHMAFSPSGELVAAIARRWIYLWPVDAFHDPRAKPEAILTIEDANRCASIAFSADSKRLAVGCDDAGVRIFDLTNGKLTKKIRVHKSAVRDVAFSPDGSKLATASEDRTFTVSPLNFDELYEAALRLQSATADEPP